jgi:secreted PhoX family phosphatase
LTEEKKKSGPSILRTKAEKRSRELGAVEGMSRRRFLTFLGTGSAALAAGSAGILTGCSEGQETASEGAGEGSGGEETTQAAPASGNGQPFFTSIEATDEDDLIVPEGFEYTIIRRSEDPMGGDMIFGDHADFIAYFAIDAQDGGDNSEDGLLWVNHEYINPLFWSNYDDPYGESETEKTVEQINKEKSGVGGAVIRVRMEDGEWTFVEDDEMNRRVDATTPMDVTGPASGAEIMKGATEVIGSMGNCSGGVTPWNTVLSCEENYQDYYGQRTNEDGEPGMGTAAEPEELDMALTYRWLDDPDNAHPPEHYGWVFELDSFDPESKPRKHSWLGRLRHENAAITIAPDDRVVVYTGHDEVDQCIYKFISSGTYEEGNREANLDLLTDGMLYVADFSTGTWNAMDFEENPLFEENGFQDQGDVLTRAYEAAALPQEEDGPPLGTPMDRCEDIEVHPETGQVYCALTNNEAHGNFYGQIIRMTEEGDDPTAESFAFEVFAAGGPQTGFAAPDNLMFDNENNLWVVTDMSSSGMNQGIYTTFRNNGAFMIPTDIDGGISGSEVFQFASAPIAAELTGPALTPDGQTLFLAIQHPGETSESRDEPTSTWPDGESPKSSVVAITGGFPNVQRSSMLQG